MRRGFVIELGRSMPTNGFHLDAIFSATKAATGYRQLLMHKAATLLLRQPRLNLKYHMEYEGC